jgi:hypothetical protein
MPDSNLEREIVVLFDEHGTPTFQPERETDWFLGVTATYDLADEEQTFNSCRELFGLCNTKPLKNRHIDDFRAERISNLAARLPIQIVVKSVNLADSEFQQTMTIYVEFFNELRKMLPYLEESNLAQRLYSQILGETVVESIKSYLERHLASSCISVYVDHHCFAREDIEIHLKDWPTLIQDDVNSLYERHGADLNVPTVSISLMEKDSPRKRFVDVITSVVSRSFKRQNNERFSQIPLQTLTAKGGARCEDITQSSIRFIRGLMDNWSRNPPVG